MDKGVPPHHHVDIIQWVADDIRLKAFQDLCEFLPASMDAVKAGIKYPHPVVVQRRGNMGRAEREQRVFTVLLPMSC